MFVTVRYGDDKSKIFNAHCRNEILLENIKQQCGCQQHDVVELCDEQGVVKNLRNFPTQYGSAFLKERETLVLLAVRQDGTCDTDGKQTEKPVFTPLLASLCNDRHFNDTLNPDRELMETDNATSGRRQQLPSDTDDDAFNKSFKGKVKAMNSNNSSSGTPAKKSILRKSTKAFLRK